MDWILIVLILTEAPNFAQSHSHQFVNFVSEKLCKDGAALLQGDFSKPTANGMNITVRTSCLQRKG